MATETPLSTNNTAGTSARASARRATARTSELATTAGSQGRQVAGVAADESRQVVRAAADDARQLAAAAREQASSVAQEVAAQGRSLVAEARALLEDQAQIEAERLAAALRTFASKAESLAKAASAGPDPLADFIFRTAESFDRLADEVETRGPEGLLEELRDTARRHPGAFLAGAAVAGFGIGRILRSTGDEDEEEVVEPVRTARTRNGRRPAALPAGDR